MLEVTQNYRLRCQNAERLLAEAMFRQMKHDALRQGKREVEKLRCNLENSVISCTLYSEAGGNPQMLPRICTDCLDLRDWRNGVMGEDCPTWRRKTRARRLKLFLRSYLFFIKSSNDRHQSECYLWHWNLW